jgi:hypothetical protein
MNSAFKNLSRNTRLAVGLTVIAWGGLGLWYSDRAEQKYQPTEKDKDEMAKYTPKLTPIDK